MRTTITALALAALTACGQAPEGGGRDEPRRLVAETPRGKTFDNPFDANASEPTEDAGAMAATDPTAPIATDPMVEPERSTEPAPSAYSPMPTSGRSCNDGKRVCGDMDSCEDAQFHLQQCGMSRLDGDSDGTPCEKICGG